MVDKLNLSLDDIIKINKKTSKGTRGRGAGRRGRGNTRGSGRGSGRGNARGKGITRGVARGGVSQARNRRGATRGRGRGRPAAFTRAKSAPSGKWDHDMFTTNKQGLKTASLSRGGNGKLLVSNLDFAVSDSDISELFSEFGAIRRAAVHYDRTGRSLGSADVHFERRNDAVKAVQQYNGVPLDGRAMKITFVEGNAPLAPRGRGTTRGARGAGRGARGGSAKAVGGGNQKSGRGSSRGRGGRGRGRGRGRGGRGGGQQRKPVSIEELDKQLDEYISKND